MVHRTARHSGCIHLLRAVQAVDHLSGLTPARLSALSVLVFAGPRTLGDLARAEGRAGPTMTRTVDALVDEGLVARRPHERDGRAVLLAATPKGTALMDDAAQRRLDAILRALHQLPRNQQMALLAGAPALDPLAAAVRDGVADRKRSAHDSSRRQ